MKASDRVIIWVVVIAFVAAGAAVVLYRAEAAATAARYGQPRARIKEGLRLGALHDRAWCITEALRRVRELETDSEAIGNKAFLHACVSATPRGDGCVDVPLRDDPERFRPWAAKRCEGQRNLYRCEVTLRALPEDCERAPGVK